MARYRKVDPRIWNDKKFMELSDDGQLLFLFLLTHPNQTALGAFRTTISGLADEKGWLTERLTESLTESLSRKMVLHHKRASCVWLPNFLKYNRPESPNVVKAWGAAADLIPECDLKIQCLRKSKDFLKGFPKGFQEAFAKAFPEGLPKEYGYTGAGAVLEDLRGREDRSHILLSPQAPKAAAAHKPEPRSDTDDYENWERFKAAYPKGIYAQADFLLAQRECYQRLDEGATWEQILGGAERFAAQVEACGNTGGRFVPSPKNFFERRAQRWLEPYPLPVTPAATTTKTKKTFSDKVAELRGASEASDVSEDRLR